MSCPKNCKCEQCEHLQTNEFIKFVDDRNPFGYQPSVVYRGFRCTYTGMYDIDTKSLKIGGFIDDVVYASSNKIAVDYINLHRKIQGE